MNTLDLPTVDEIAAAIQRPPDAWAHQCHAISLSILRAGVTAGWLPTGSRVARGWCDGPRGQHSWIVVTDQPTWGASTPVYDPDAVLLDPTLWSYREDVTGRLLVCSPADYNHRPHRAGSIWDWGQPQPGDGEVIELTPPEGGWACRDVAFFLELLGPLDLEGWRDLAHAPAGGWPSREIWTAMAAIDAIAVLFPVDSLGNGTNLNPDGLYLPQEAP